MPAKYEGMVVDGHHWRGTSRSDVGENICGVYILAEGMKDEVVTRWCNVLVECWSRTYLLAKFLLRASVPCDAEAIDVEHAVASCDLLL